MARDTSGLRPFEKGNRANPGGFRKVKMFKASLERALLRDNSKLLEAVVQTLCREAIAGEPWAIMMIADRVDGQLQRSFGTDEEGNHVPFRGVIELVRAANE